MEVECEIVTILGTQYVRREDAERLLTQADERRRVQMQGIIDTLGRTFCDTVNKKVEFQRITGRIV